MKKSFMLSLQYFPDFIPWYYLPTDYINIIFLVITDIFAAQNNLVYCSVDLEVFSLMDPKLL